MRGERVNKLVWGEGGAHIANRDRIVSPVGVQWSNKHIRNDSRQQTTDTSKRKQTAINRQQTTVNRQQTTVCEVESDLLCEGRVGGGEGVCVCVGGGGGGAPARNPKRGGGWR
jgi:hypothetical protein